ncbi:transcription termination/antitermination protein NusG [Wolbachia endosymbiont of Howardula sp.]|uniref:transcription termination/antitermination protein NusG n=1 Tax=Wolbachia endosymbiont of Howardula sp. TaxID=2916816 RepID=UPI00217DACF8|nr:transcription termination/antitermination protein NusG [Wolbachia endosymbiont of Howardula sp.]UWI82983.1 transcription termination/antitermination protein NusG [Wolbachia endosymbiont of Howardula sp.]
MENEYKWYVIKVNYGCEHKIQELIDSTIYFKEVFIPFSYHITHAIQEQCNAYIHMNLCDESTKILSQYHVGDFTVISESEIHLIRQDYNKNKWYILRVAANYEEKVRRHILENTTRLRINQYFKEVFIPYDEINDSQTKYKKNPTRKKCFPGYVFLYINLCDEVLNFINSIPKSLKVYGFLKNGHVPKIISEDEIYLVCRALRSAQEAKKLSFGYEKGEKIKIKEGLFQNFTGKVEMINEEKKTMNVEVSILGKPTLIELDLSEVDKIED